MEALGPVRLRDVEAAQQEILKLVRQLQSEGALDLRGTEQYVV
jgi:flagellar motor switch protein FliG